MSMPSCSRTPTPITWHGIDDLRALSVRQGAMLPAYGSRATMAELVAKFPVHLRPLDRRARDDEQAGARGALCEPGVRTPVAGVTVLALPLPHGEQVVFGYRVGLQLPI